MKNLDKNLFDIFLIKSIKEFNQSGGKLFTSRSINNFLLNVNYHKFL